MSHPSSSACSRCGASIPAGATDQVCPACLMSGALAETPAAPPPTAETTAKPMTLPRELGGYRLLSLLGSGGMGTVYEAEQLATGRRVALKMLEHRLDSAEMRQRFLREGRLAASVNHPNSLYVFGSEEIDGIPVITMEIAGRGTLSDTLKKSGPLPVAAAVDAILDVIAGLEAASAGGVLHRDVKPSNCFVSPDGSVKVGDFGLSVSTLARDDSYATVTGVIMGTPAYAPPEQLRGDDLDLRADIYSVGATLFTLLTGKAPFEGKNAVQVVANAVNQDPMPLRELREDAPSGLERVVAQCLQKEPAGRYADYMALRNALLPFSSKEQEPAPLTVRAAAGWVDYLIAFLVPYVPLMFAVGGEQFHLQPFLDHTLSSASAYLACFGCAILYFTLAEGIWGAGVGKRLKGLRVVGADGRSPGILRAMVRIVLPVLGCEGVRLSVLAATISATTIDEVTGANVAVFFIASIACPWIPVLLTLGARRANGFATVWDRLSGTRVVVRPTGTLRHAIVPVDPPGSAATAGESAGPYRITGELVPEQWLAADDRVLRRSVWLLRRDTSEQAAARRNLARPGRLRWLQQVEHAGASWDAFEAQPGAPARTLIGERGRLPWGTLRHWLHDLASEMWSAAADGTLPAALSLDHVWVTASGRAVLLDEPWPAVAAPAERIGVADLAGQQRFLDAVSAHVDATGLPQHARPLLRNLRDQKFEKLSFLTGTLRGVLDQPAEVGRGIRAASLFVLPVYTWLLVFVGSYRGAEWLYEIVGESTAWIALSTATAVLVCYALAQLLELPFKTTASHATFRLAVVDADGEPAGMSTRLARWAIVWLPLLLPLSLLLLLSDGRGTAVFAGALTVLLLWIGVAVHAALHPHRGLHDRLARTWVVRS